MRKHMDDSSGEGIKEKLPSQGERRQEEFRGWHEEAKPMEKRKSLKGIASQGEGKGEGKEVLKKQNGQNGVKIC